MGAAKKRTGSQKKPSKSKSTSASRRAQRKATGQAAQKAGKYKSVKPSAAATRARSRASERRKKSRQQAAAQASAAARIRAAEKAAANKAAEAAKRGPSATRAAAENKARQAAAARMMAVNNPPSAPRTPPEMSPRNIAAQQAARQAQARFAAQAATAQKEKARVAAARSAAAAAARRDANRPSVVAHQRASSFPKVKPQPKPEGMSLSRAKAGLYNLLPEFLRTDNKSGRTAEQQAFHDSIHGADARRDRRRKKKERVNQIEADPDLSRPDSPTPEVDPFRPIIDPSRQPEVMPPFDPRFPQYPGMSGGIGAFGYSPASLMFESQQGAGQVPYYMAAARNAINPNLSPAFINAARNYDILGGMQRVMPRPIEMMSARERGQIMDMGSNFSVPNYNSPYYQPSPQSQFDFFNNMVGRGGGKGMGRPMSQPMARAMAGGLGSFFGGFT